MSDEQKIEETLSRRGGTYGDFRDNARISQNIKKAMQDSPNWQVLPPYLKEGLELIALKMSRILSGDPLYADNPHDMIGYAKLIEDRAAQDRAAGVVIPSPGDPLYPEYDHTHRGDTITETVRVGDISKTTTRPYSVEGLHAAIEHTVNYFGLDARLNKADYVLADMLTPEIERHLRGETSVQVLEAMSPEERAKI